MAVETPSISKPLAQQPSMDYEALYLEGLRHIESLAGRIWTDYNAHDPGITVMEMLCYAITELGYRTQFEIGDIIEPEPDSGATQDFFTLGQVGSNAPLTISDFRKVLIDLDGIRNAWLEKLEGERAPKPDLYWLLSTGDTEPHLQNYDAPGAKKIDLRGLYNVYVQFEEHPEFGDLNDNSISTFFMIRPIGNLDDVRFDVEIEFPLFEELSDELDAVYEAVQAAAPGGGTVFELQLQGNQMNPLTGQQWDFQCTLELNPNGRMVEIPLVIRIMSGQETILNYTEFIARLKDEFVDLDPGPAALPSYDGGPFDLQQEIVQVMLTFLRRRALIQTYLESARAALAEHRNLCEDFQAVYPMGLQEIGLDVDVVVKPGADCEEVMARIFAATERYLSPPIKFYSLREMLDKGYKPEEIFEGPWLCNGFIDDAEAAFNERREMLYTSDLLQEFMKIPGVEAIRYLALSRYLQGVRQESGRTECLCLVDPGRLLPRLNYAFSHVGMDCGGGQFVEPEKSKVLEILAALKALDNLKGSTGRGDFAIPAADYRDLEDYYSIQNEFPLTYAIGVEGLVATEPEARKAQAKQLKAYLLFFEQLLANYLSQLAHVRQLYSYQEEDRTYFTQTLFQVPRVRELIANAQGLDDNDYADYVNLPSLDPEHLGNRVNAIAEDLETFQDRRHRFLNHLLSRFNESFSEYASYVFSRNMPKAQQYNRLIQDQARFLRNYALDSLGCMPGGSDRRRGHSNNRGTAFNYTLPLNPGFVPGSYFDENVAALYVEGLKKRMVYLTGLPKVEREYINPFERLIVSEPTPSNWVYSFMAPDMVTTMLASPTGWSYPTEGILRDLFLQIIQYAQTIANFVDNGTDIELRMDPLDMFSVVGVIDPAYRSSFTSDSECIETLRDALLAVYSVENFHIVEHILLRQRSSGDPFLPLRYFSDCNELSIEDPYSFRVSVVLPNWAGRFAEMDFRRLFKRLMRVECPAHIYIHFYWVDPYQMAHFEHCWNDWLNGEWIDEDLRLLWQEDNLPDSGPMLQENFYDILVERQENLGDDDQFFANCFAELRNLEDAYYTLEPYRIVDLWNNCDIMATVLDPDSEIVRAEIVEGTLPPGVCLDPCTGTLRVVNAAALAGINIYSWPLVILTTSASGEQTYHNFSLYFTPNGPAYVSFRSSTRHVDSFADGEVLRTFADPDAAIVMATLVTVTYIPTATGFNTPALPGGLPPGMLLDMITGEITVDNSDDLYPGTYSFMLRLLDANGGETLLVEPIIIDPDIEAVGKALTPPSLNQDAYQLGDKVAKISDDDGDIVYFAMRAGERPLADLGLVANTTGTPIEVEISIGDLGVFQSALNTFYNLSTGMYNYTLRMETRDIKNGESSVDIQLTVRRDNAPVFLPVPIVSVDQHPVGSLLGSVTDTGDGGIQSFSTTADLVLMGIQLAIESGNVLRIRVVDDVAFRAFMDTLTPDPNNIVGAGFLIEMVDNTGGVGSVNALIRARLDQEPIIDYMPAYNVDTYAKKQVLLRIWDPDGNGIVSATQVGGTTLANLGLVLVVGPQTGYPTPVAYIMVGDLATFVNAVSYNPAFVPVTGGSANLVKATVQVDTQDSLGGIGHLDVDIEVIRDIEATVLTVLNGLRVNAYNYNDVLFRFQDNDPTTYFVSCTFDNSLPAGLDLRSVVGQYEIYVSNSFALVAGSYPLEVTLTDNGSGVTVLNITVEILRRLVSVSFAVEAMNVSHILDLNAKVIGLSANSLSYSGMPKSFGTLIQLNSTQLGFTEGTGFASTMLTRMVQFDGQVGAELVEGRLSISRSFKAVKSPGGSSILVSGYFSSNRLLNNSLVFGNQELLRAINSTGRLMNDLNNGTFYMDNPTLRTNPNLVVGYWNGDKDAETLELLDALMDQSGMEIERLQGLVARSQGKIEVDSRAQLSIWAELYRQQVIAAVNYMGQVRRMDVTDALAQLIVKIASLNAKMQ